MYNTIYQKRTLLSCPVPEDTMKSICRRTQKAIPLFQFLYFFSHPSHMPLTYFFTQEMKALLCIPLKSEHKKCQPGVIY